MKILQNFLKDKKIILTIFFIKTSFYRIMEEFRILVSLYGKKEIFSKYFLDYKRLYLLYIYT